MTVRGLLSLPFGRQAPEFGNSPKAVELSWDSNAFIVPSPHPWGYCSLLTTSLHYISHSLALC